MAMIDEKTKGKVGAWARDGERGKGKRRGREVKGRGQREFVFLLLV